MKIKEGFVILQDRNFEEAVNFLHSIIDWDKLKIAEEKATDMNTDDVEAVMKMVAGTARSMGVEVETA